MTSPVLIKNGTLYTGERSKPATIRDILIVGGRVKQISTDKIIPPPGTHVIDAYMERKGMEVILDQN